MRIYTKFGDTGNTALIGGKVVSKDHPRVSAYGSIDELNSVLGIVIAFSELKELTDSLTKIQNDLFVIGAVLAGATDKELDTKRVSDLESEIDQLETKLPPLKNFILPGGSKTAALLHHARTVCRRSEREIVSLSKIEKIDSGIIVYMNRLSDMLFIHARFVNQSKKVTEVIWKGKND